ncbi:MAG: Peptide chain release factor 3 [Candidatus Anoxychlamydiales bacterium]|nr:Peptide chain release factor 3 [Candidatus Anoxychlamydiales bacterium]
MDNPQKISLSKQISSRRTFAIISHPDAGKTTLTEKLLLYSGQLHTAGIIRGRKGRKFATSDWMSMEQERGISITSSAMQFSYKDVIINILDTPGHEDFSEDTFRTLTAADCAIMVIDAAKGIEKQTLKLFEVCRLRKIPVLTFINKMDMPGRDPLDLMDEVEVALKIKSYAYNWPIGLGKEFCGVYDRLANQALLFESSAKGGTKRATMNKHTLEDPKILNLIGQSELDQLKEDLSLLDTAGNSFNKEEFLSSSLTPVFFASALSNFGIEPFFDTFINLAPPPSARFADTPEGTEILIDPVKNPFSAYVFKVQANMDRKHHDSLAFLRICSGEFEKDMVIKHHRLNRDIRLARPHSMFAGERVTLSCAVAGDIVGVINPSIFFIGDTVSLTGGFNFKPLPQFQPEIFAKVTPKNVGKRKAFDKGIKQLAEEGAIQILYNQNQFNSTFYGAVGRLQFEVLQYRLQDEYKVETNLELLPYQCSSWIIGDIDTYKKPFNSIIVKDRWENLMVLFNSSWEKQYAIQQNPNHQFIDVKY